jgi:hypothetical protein
MVWHNLTIDLNDQLNINWRIDESTKDQDDETMVMILLSYTRSRALHRFLHGKQTSG